MPMIAIVGRPNVGKSSLLNALVGKRISIVDDMAGVTRDRVAVPWEIEGRFVELVDTGGYGFIDPDALTEHIKHQIELAMGRADLVLFIVDCQVGLTEADKDVAALLRRQGIKTVLIANKADGERVDAMLGEFAKLGLGTPLGVSAMNGRNLPELMAAIRANIDLSEAPKELPEPEMLLAIVGKRNAGKSTLVNTIAQIYEGDTDRVIVSEVPGTTRDSIDVRVEKEGHTLVVIDTAGVRKKRHMMTNDLEFYSFHRAERSIRRADVVLLLIDATEPLSDPDKKLAQYVAEQYKPVILVINKWDLAKDIARRQQKEGGDAPTDREMMEQYREYLEAELRHLDYAPIAFTTAKDGKNIQVVLDLAQHLFKQARQRVTTGRLNQTIKTIFEERTPSTPSGRRPRVYYATQIETAPPTIVLVVNKVAYLDETYQRFIINRMRDLLPYPEVPIRLLLRQRTQKLAGQEPEVTEESGPAGAPKEVSPRKSPPAPLPKPRTAKRESRRGRRG
ncbi:MAG TPA: ribosome biogenesis GTPase Der [Tepidisphaeraceae bacterium]|nr:ribosome biogenesis GTPase Der [Tepidisphaeraceae bacterium]